VASSPERAELARIRSAYTRYERDRRERRRRDPLNKGLTRLQQDWWSHLGERLLARGLPTETTRILDIGCGSGQLLAFLMELGAKGSNCSGIDLMPDRVEAARERVPSATVLCGNASKLAWPDAAFDLVTMSMVLSSILADELANAVCGEVDRVLAPGGTLVWYDTRYPNPLNRDVRALRARQVRKLFPSYRGNLEPVTLLPPIARHLGRTAPVLYPILASIRPLRARYLGLLEKGASA
jgi:ubiquinone/menaquinone biosynthesis C-methylase UbiE